MHRDRYVVRYWLVSTATSGGGYPSFSMQVDTHLCLLLQMMIGVRPPEVGSNLFQPTQRHFILLRDIGVIQSHLLVVFRYLCICWFIR
ncbi:hypothetical protein MYEC719_p30085 (plasmid) [Escherichia coli]|nr:hypothetical protein MYEC719_p30085 [Escherichia coli]